MDNRAWLEMMEEATCYRDNGLGMVRASRMPPPLGTGCANNRPIKTVYAANVKPRIARNLRLNVIYSTRGAPSPPPPSLWGEGGGGEWERMVRQFQRGVRQLHAGEIGSRSWKICIFVEF